MGVGWFLAHHCLGGAKAAIRAGGSEWLPFTVADIAPLADQVVASPYANPVPVTRDGVVRLLQAAWAGEPPAVGLQAGGELGYDVRR